MSVIKYHADGGSGSTTDSGNDSQRGGGGAKVERPGDKPSTTPPAIDGKIEVAPPLNPFSPRLIDDYGLPEQYPEHEIRRYDRYRPESAETSKDWETIAWTGAVAAAAVIGLPVAVAGGSAIGVVLGVSSLFGASVSFAVHLAATPQQAAAFDEEAGALTSFFGLPTFVVGELFGAGQQNSIEAARFAAGIEKIVGGFHGSPHSKFDQIVRTGEKIGGLKDLGVLRGYRIPPEATGPLKAIRPPGNQ